MVTEYLPGKETVHPLSCINLSKPSGVARRGISCSVRSFSKYEAFGFILRRYRRARMHVGIIMVLVSKFDNTIRILLCLFLTLEIF